MGNQTSNHQTYHPVATAILLDTPVVTAYAVEDDNKSPSAPPMPINKNTPFIPEGRMRNGELRIGEMERDAIMRQQFIANKNKLFGKIAPEASAPPEPSALPLEMLPLRNQYKIYSDSIVEIERGVQKNYFEDSYERGLREGIDRCYVALVRDFLKSGKLDKLEILTRELDYVNERIAVRKCNKRRTQIKELIEERLKIVLRQI